MKNLIAVLLVVILLVLSGGDVVAGEHIFTADGGFRLNIPSSNQKGLDLATDGKATVKWMWLKKNQQVGAGDVARSDPPSGTIGNSSYALRSWTPPRHFDYYTSPPDSVWTDVDTANEVILTW